MNRGRPIPALLVAAALGASLAAACARREPAPARIVLIVVDTLRRDQLAAFGPAGATPHLDALALRGRAEPALASFHQTTMSMAALFTGRTPSLESTAPARPLPWNSSTWCGLARLAAGGEAERCLPAGVPTLAERLRAAGYATIGVTSNPLLFEPAGFARGFDDWTEVGRDLEGRERAAGGAERRPAGGAERRPAGGGAAVDRGEVLAALRARLAALRTAAEGRTGSAVNRAVEAALARRSGDRFFLYAHYMDAHDYHTFGSDYADGVRRADAAVGELLRRLESEGLLEDAVVIATADHGESLGERHALRPRPQHAGNPSFETLVQVPLVVAPDRARAREGALRTQDLFALIAGIAGVEAAAPEELGPGELFLSEVEYQTFRKGDWKSLRRRRDGRTFLFDLAADPGETRDVAAAHPEVVAAHRERVAALARSLAAARAPRDELGTEERARLRALGYLESPNAEDDGG
jgi:arylsulfatase A-like enzyme